MMKWSWWILLWILPACTSSELVDPAGKSEHATQRTNAQLDAVAVGSTCDSATSVAATFAPAAGHPGTTALPIDDPRIVAWANGVLDIDYGAKVDEKWKVPERALGAAQGTSTDVVSLGEGGAITLGFAQPIVDINGPDLCVFENSFSDTFLEFAFVEVASDATVFVRFGAYSRVTSPVDTFGTIDPTLVDGLAGKYRQGFCTPFDLAWLYGRPEVLSGALDLNSIRYVRIHDIVGDGTELDCASAPIYDPYPTTGGAGFDLDGIAVLEAAP